MTAFSLWTLIGGVAAVAIGIVIVALVIRPARKPPARRLRTPRPVPAAGRVYRSSSRAAGVAPVRDRGRVAAAPAAVGATLPLDHPAWTVPVGQHVQVRPGRHRTHAGVSR